MTIGTIIENMSGRKLMYVVSGLIVLQILCFLIGAIVSPTPNSSMQVSLVDSFPTSQESYKNRLHCK